MLNSTVVTCNISLNARSDWLTLRYFTNGTILPHQNFGVSRDVRRAKFIIIHYKSNHIIARYNDRSTRNGNEYLDTCLDKNPMRYLSAYLEMKNAVNHYS